VVLLLIVQVSYNPTHSFTHSLTDPLTHSRMYSLGGKHYGILIPHHNGNYFFGKVVRVDLKLMENTTYCKYHYRYEYYDTDSSSIKSTGVSKSQACIFVLDLASVNENARGFRKGFVGKIPHSYSHSLTHSPILTRSFTHSLVLQVTHMATFLLVNLPLRFGWIWKISNYQQ